jgi:phage terminase large subunit
MAISEAAGKIKLWRERPSVFVRDVFGVTPDAWQDDVLDAFPSNPRIALKACAGPGKTAVLAWLCWNFLLTRPHPKIAATAISGENLKDNLWTEMAKWQQKSELLKATFEWQAERIFCREHPQTWWMSARRWSKSATPDQQGNTMRGLHDDYVMAVLDESGGIPQAVMATVENIGSSAKEWHIVQAGNPTHLEGPLYTACTKGRGLWHVVEITADPDDPKRTPRVSVQWARDQIATYGADNPWVLVNIFGKFPPASLNSLIGPDEVNAALGRHITEDKYSHAARVLGVDVGRFGDDPSVIFPRQGLAAFQPIVLRNADSMQGAGHVQRKWTEWRADGCFVDGTGGFGAGWVDALRNLGRSPIDVQFASRPNDPMYFNKRAELWFEGCQWIKDGGCLPNIPDIVGELTVPTYTFKGDKLILEDKNQIKLRLGRSPNYADALFTTFAEPVYVDRRFEGVEHLVANSYGKAKRDYDPFAADRA